jgi:hypothetical protein
MLKSKILLDVNFQGHKGREQKNKRWDVMIAHVKREKADGAIIIMHAIRALFDIICWLLNHSDP